MALQTLAIQLPRGNLTPESVVNWSLIPAGSGQCSVRQGPLAGIANAVSVPAGRYWTMVLAPAEDISLHFIDLPTRQLGRVKQALPYAMADSVAEEIVKVHLALPPVLPSQDHALPVAAVGHATLIHWLDILHQCQLAPDELVADAWCAPSDSGLSVSLLDDMMVLRRGDWAYRVLPKALLVPAVADQLGGMVSGNNRVTVNSYEGQDPEWAKAATLELHDALDVDVHQRRYRETWVQALFLAASSRQGKGMNLLSGGYNASRKARAADSRGRWPAIAAAAAVGFVSACLMSASVYDDRARDFESAQIALLRQVLPDTGRVVNPRRQLQAAIEAGSANQAGFVRAMALFGAGVSASGSQVELRHIRFDRQNQQMELELAAASVGQLQRLAGQIQSSGGANATLRNSRQVSGGALATLRLEVI